METQQQYSLSTCVIHSLSSDPVTPFDTCSNTIARSSESRFSMVRARVESGPGR
jgi:hypothetical protein